MCVKDIVIVDTTLRYGAQAAGVVFHKREKVRIAKLLDEIGVPQIEAGVPSMGGDEKEAIKAICRAGLGASIMSWNRPVIKDIEASLECGVDAVAISVPTSDTRVKRKLILERMAKAVRFAKKEGLYVSVDAGDASQSEPDFLLEFAGAAKEAGADRLRYCDTAGITEPFTIYEQIKRIRDKVDIDIEMHTQNDLGMATANALAGVKAGAGYIMAAILGLGGKTGCASLEEVVMAMKHLYNMDLNFKTEIFVEAAEYVSRASGRELPAWKPIVGSNMFAHESGIHADGVQKNPKTYEPFQPEEVGLSRRIVIGKHSGTAALKAKFEEFGITLTEQQARELLSIIRLKTISMKRNLFDRELMYAYIDYFSKEHH